MTANANYARRPFVMRREQMKGVPESKIVINTDLNGPHPEAMGLTVLPEGARQSVHNRCVMHTSHV